MNEINNSPACERAPDLIAFLYNETNESETRDFELHLNNCSVCRAEVASFGVVRESITAWRDEALSGFVSTPLAATEKKKSAIAALRQFFDLSPLWLKAATSFAVIALFVLAVMAIIKVPAKNEVVTSTPPNPDAIYTAQDLDRAVKEALAKQTTANTPVENPTMAQSPKPKRTAKPAQFAKSRRPLSRAEREQLATDLRLISTPDDVGLTLLGDRINQ